ncbi:MAG: TlyA family RNA methyltransferase [Candidatus Eremiobacteraeota bacterium]|nr:TlyA family RNA methyltransferase [Candidatus Eremiobacteraeota bacterium]
MTKRRLDAVVAERFGLSRARAQALILAGRVKLGGEPHRKAGEFVPPDAVLVVEDDARYVGRGGAKLERALDEFDWSPDGLRCLDVGASTGGFTDCLLQRGAVSVTAVDVGYGQIAWSLRNDPRVRLFERCNFRHATAQELGGPFGFATADVSFISLTAIAPALTAMLEPGARCVVLVKPQFEAGRGNVSRGGVVRDQQTQAQAIERVAASFARAGLSPQKLTFSPLLGPAGNIEFLLGACRADVGARPLNALPFDIAGVVEKAHETLLR